MLGPFLLLQTAVGRLAVGIDAFAASPASSFGAVGTGLSGMPLIRPKGLLTVSGMRVANTADQGSKLFFGPNSDFALGTDTAGNFELTQANQAVPLLSLDSKNELHLGAQRVEALAVDASGGVTIRGVRQWALAVSEDFSLQAGGWSRADVSQCAGIHMLGGYCKFGHGDVNKTFAGLPPHSQLKIVATYHFIDRWIGETGYMKANIGQDNCEVLVWAEQHTQGESKNGLSLCGQTTSPEGKFAVPIEVVVPHTQDSLVLGFGSTMDAVDPCDESWGVSGVELYVRS